jgi:two-component system nitrogen regulation response regulator NtrX
MESILIVDDEKNILKSLSGLLKDEGYEVQVASNGSEALSMIKDEVYQLVLLDIKMPGLDGLEVLEEIKKKRPDLIVVMMSGYGTIELATKAIKLGAYDFLEKPIEPEKILVTLKNAFRYQNLRAENIKLKSQLPKYSPLIGESRAIREVKEAIKRVAPTDARVLIMGESGVGKELVAQEIFRQSKRVSQPFIELNCAAIPRELIESELFGYEKGAFTGAVQRQLGKFELANRGTLFLDEIGDLSLDAQAKVLRVLEEAKFRRIGGKTLIAVDVRIICATNKDLQAEIKNHKFREDLFYRLNVFPILVPPLRERKEDIPLLIEYFLSKLAEEFGQAKKHLTPEAISYLQNYSWPGNVRELRNTLERVVIMARGEKITRSDVLLVRFPPVEEINLKNRSFREKIEAYEKRIIKEALAETGGNISETARRLKLDRSTLYRKMEYYKLRV